MLLENGIGTVGQSRSTDASYYKGPGGVLERVMAMEWKEGKDTLYAMEAKLTGLGVPCVRMRVHTLGQRECEESRWLAFSSG